MKKETLLILAFIGLASCGGSTSPNMGSLDSDSIASIEIESQIESENHLTFKNLPIDGKLEDFVSKMQSLGFEKIAQSNDRFYVGYKMKGVFAGKDVDILVKGTIKTRTTWAVNIFMPKEYTSWQQLKESYRELASLYTDKYGAPNEEMEEFFLPYKDGDGHEMEAIKKNEVVYFSRYDREGGVILVSIDDGLVNVSYEDKENGGLFTKEGEESKKEDKRLEDI